jgi:hypothetical protein
VRQSALIALALVGGATAAPFGCGGNHSTEPQQEDAARPEAGSTDATMEAEGDEPLAEAGP